MLFGKKTHPKTQKINNKKESELGLDPPTNFRVFLGFFDFFKLDKTLYLITALYESNNSKYLLSSNQLLLFGIAYPVCILESE